jgi:polar amino acid transport system substrate-binding protein
MFRDGVRSRDHPVECRAVAGPGRIGDRSRVNERTGSRRYGRRAFLQGTLFTGALAATGGCAALGLGDTLSRIRDEQVVRVGIAGERPYSYLEGDRFEGAIAAVHREVFRRIGDIEVEPVVTLFGELVEALNGGVVDAIAAGMFVTADRCELVAFSAPVYCAPTALLVAAGNPQQLNDLASVALTGARLAVLAGAVEQDYARAAGVGTDRIVAVGTPDAGLEAVVDGDADAFTLTAVSLRSLLAPAGGVAPPEVELLPPFEPVIGGVPRIGCGAAAFRRTDDTLRAEFDGVLTALRNEGTLLELMAPFGFTRAEMPDPAITTEQLCQVGGVTGTELDPPPR